MRGYPSRECSFLTSVPTNLEDCTFRVEVTFGVNLVSVQSEPVHSDYRIGSVHPAK